MFATGAFVFLIVHVIVQKVYERFAGSIGKATEAAEGYPPNEVVFIAGGPDGKSTLAANGGGEGAHRVLLSAEDQSFRDVPLK